MAPQRHEETRHVHQVTQEDSSEVYTMYNLPGAQIDPIQVVVWIGDQELPMEVDTGASLSIKLIIPLLRHQHCYQSKPDYILTQGNQCPY